MRNKQLLARYGAAVLLVFVAAFSRLLPHPANFTAIAAIALFGGVYLEKRFAFIVPILAMLMSDYVIGFYSGMYWVYGSFVLVGLIGRMAEKPQKGSIRSGWRYCEFDAVFCRYQFWSVDDTRINVPPTWAGLVECYVFAIPFFRNTLAGDLFFVTVMFAAYEGLLAVMKKMRTERSVIG